MWTQNTPHNSWKPSTFLCIKVGKDAENNEGKTTTCSHIAVYFIPKISFLPTIYSKSAIHEHVLFVLNIIVTHNTHWLTLNPTALQVEACEKTTKQSNLQREILDFRGNSHIPYQLLVTTCLIIFPLIWMKCSNTSYKPFWNYRHHWDMPSIWQHQDWRESVVEFYRYQLCLVCSCWK